MTGRSLFRDRGVLTALAAVGFTFICAPTAARFTPRPLTLSGSSILMASNDRASSQSQTSNDQTKNAAGGMATLSVADRRFVQDAFQNGLAEIEGARLAISRTQDEKLRDTARQLIRDHEQANDKLRSLATTEGVSLPDKPKPEQVKQSEALKALPNDQFDAAYIKHASDAHKKSIALFERTARESGNSRIKNFATETLPTLRHHLEMLQGLNKDG